MAANVGASDAFDLNANWYGNIFSSTDILNAFRNKGGSYDLEAGYSHALFNSEYDLRLKAAGYQFDTGNTVSGYRTGADLTTKNGMFMLRYEYGNDRINGSWNNVGAFVNIGFQMENIIKGESPFTAPEPVFKSPRNLARMLAQKVKRDWNQQYAPGRAALAATAAAANAGFVRTADFPGPLGEGGTTKDLSAAYFSDVCNFTTLTISFENAPTGTFILRLYIPTDVNYASATFIFTEAPPYPKTFIFNNTTPYQKFFGDCNNPEYYFYKLELIPTAAWTPGLVTLTWQ